MMHWSALVVGTLLLSLSHGVEAQDNNPVVDTSGTPPLPEIIGQERERCGGIFDMHFHLAQWFSTAGPLLQEMDISGVDVGLLYAGADTNDVALALARKAVGDNNEQRLYVLANLDTSIPNWTSSIDDNVELKNLADALEDPLVKGTKLATPHTCLELNGPRMKDIIAVTAASSSPVMAIHTGTTPFCGPLGDLFGLTTCCTRDYVDPALLEESVAAYPDVTFLLLHAGHEFLPTDSPDYYNFSLVDNAIAMALQYPNVYLEISAMHAQDDDGTLRYPGGDANVKKMVDAGLADQMIFGSDANHRLGSLAPVLATSFRSLVAAGLSEDERCEIINTRTLALLGIDVEDREDDMPSNCGDLDACFLVNLDNGETIELVDGLRYEPAGHNYSIRCVTGGTIDQVTFYYNNEMHRESAEPWYLNGNSGQGVNSEAYLEDCGAKAVEVVGNVWRGTCFKQMYTFEASGC